EMYLSNCWTEAQSYELSESDFLATLTELTVLSVLDSYQRFLPHLPDSILLCGGGSHNLYLRERFKANLPSETILLTTDDVGLNVNFKEAIAFAVLAYWRFHDGFTGNLPQVTGAKQSQLLGEIHRPVLSSS
ncbi:MAG: anhydro-N-acetylmuramic acid kinase, partial [Snowella sp.]